MTAPNVVRSVAGFRRCNIFALNANSTPLGTGTVAYEGVFVGGSKTLTLNVPTSREMVFTGEDGVTALDILPPLTPADGQLTTSRINDTLDAILTGNKSFTVGDSEAKAQLVTTDNQGSEPEVGILAYREAVDQVDGSATYGKRYYDWMILPKAWLSPMMAGMEVAEAEMKYTVRPQIVQSHIWGTVFSSTEGAKRGQIVRGISEFKPKIVAYVGDNSTTDFDLPTDFPAQAATKISVWADDVLITGGDITKTTTSISFTTAPTTAARIVVFYETP